MSEPYARAAAELAEVDLAITHATVVTMDDAATVLRDTTIIVNDGTIVELLDSHLAPGPLATGLPATGPRLRARRVLDAAGAIVMPGMVNAHAHLAMTMFRGLADDCDLDGFLATMLPVEGAVLSAQTVAVASRLAVAESLRAGITTTLDMYFFPEETHTEASAGGLRLHAGPVFLEFAGPDRRAFADRMAWARDWLAEAQPGGAWLQPHSTYLLEEKQLRAIAELADETGARINVHASETAAEVAQVLARHGRRPIRVLDDCGLLGRRTVLAHGVHLDDEEIARIAASGASVVHNPASNAKLASGTARIPDLLAAGVNVALGTDGPASSNDLDLLFAMRLAAYVQKTVRRDATVVDAHTVLRMATVNGARALGLGEGHGRIAIGSPADLVVLSAEAASLAPAYDPHSAIVYAASRAEVDTVIVSGKVVVVGGRTTNIDASDAARAVSALQPTILAAMP